MTGSSALSVEERLRRIEARNSITDLVARYAHGADRKNDPAIMGPLFADDGVWLAEGFATFTGRAAIEEGLSSIAASRVLWSIHYMVAPLVELADDCLSARCSWYLWELCTMETDNGPEDQWLGGWYDSILIWTGDEWKFSKVTLDIRLQGPATPGWTFKKPAPQQ